MSSPLHVVIPDSDSSPPHVAIPNSEPLSHVAVLNSEPLPLPSDDLNKAFVSPETPITALQQSQLFEDTLQQASDTEYHSELEDLVPPLEAHFQALCFYSYSEATDTD